MSRNDVEEIKRRLPIEEIVGAYIKLEKSGKSWKGRCPFHNEKTPSFFVSPDRGGYYCFGCGAKGDIFSFVEQFEGLDFKGALKVLAEKAGVEVSFGPSPSKEDVAERDRFYGAMEEAASYFQAELGKSKEALVYLHSRGLTDESIKQFRIGYAPVGWHNLLNYLQKKGYDEKTLEKVGLVKQKESSENSAAYRGDTSVSASAKRPPNADYRGDTSVRHSLYDRFRDRIMFPITDSSGRVIAFSGRILHDDNQSAKYLNSPDTPLFDKSLVLYGLDKAKSEIRRLNYSILVEGQMDLIMSHQAGIKNTVASSGTAMSEEIAGKNGAISNLGLLKRLSPNIIVAFDADAAGRKAALRAANIALVLGMEVKIADLVEVNTEVSPRYPLPRSGHPTPTTEVSPRYSVAPEGRGKLDPADLVRDDPEKWREVIRKALPLVQFELENVLREKLDSRKTAKAVIERVLPLLAAVESNADRSFFVEMISSRAKIPVDIVWQDLSVVSAKLKKAAAPDTFGRQNTPKTSGEMTRRLDIVERRLFGLLALMKKSGRAEVAELEEKLKQIAGQSYAERSAKAMQDQNDLLFEAEAFFGTDDKNWSVHMSEMLANFERDLLSEELIATMQLLKEAEAAGNTKRLAELAKRCQELSFRKAQI